MCQNKLAIKAFCAVLFFIAVGLFTYSFIRSNHIPMKVLFGNPEKSGPAISPDGKKLAYIAPINGIRNVWVKTIGKNDDQPVTTQQERDITSCFWSYDNEHLFYQRDKGGDENFHLYMANIKTKERQDITPFDDTKVMLECYRKQFPDEMLIAMNKRDKKVFDVYRFDLKTKKLDLIAQNPGNYSDWIVDWQNKVRGVRQNNKDGGYEGLVRDDEKSEWRKLILWGLEDSSSGFIGFSKDGKYMYARDSNGANSLRLVSIDVKTGKKKVIFQDPEYDYGALVRDRDSGELLAGTVRKAKKEWHFFDENFEKDLKLAMMLDEGEIGIRSKDKDDKKWIVFFLKDNGPVSYWMFDRETKDGVFLFYTKPELNKYKLANMEPIFYFARDGLKIHGYLTYPVDKKAKNLPMVLFVHGGPWVRDSWGYSPIVQWLANRGYAVLQVNYRGSSGYGKKFLNAGNKQWGAKMHDDLVDAVNWAVEQGVADPKRVAIYGGSYGGYAALVGATFTPDLFKCAIDIVGPSNLITLLKSVPPYWKIFLERMYKRVGHPEKEEEFLKSRSPLFKADKIKIPVMVVQGANDPRVKQAEAEQIVQAMKKNGVDYEYLLFEAEGHGIRKEANRMKCYAVLEKFLKKHMS